MKKINSIWFGSKYIGACIIFIAIALVLHLASVLFGWNGLGIAVKVSLAVSVVILFVFVIILAIEAAQDKKLNKTYLSRKASRIRISDTYFECQSCGNQKVLDSHNRCRVCGVKFDQIR